MQPVSRDIIAAVVHRSTEGAASTLEAAGAEGASNSMAMVSTIKYPEGDTYIGQVDTNAQRNGKGILTWASGDVYDGQFKDGMRHGEGKYTWADGDVYDGEWSNNKKHGKGILKFKDGQEYDGEWCSGLRHGKGKMKCKDGQEYDGEWSNNKEHGKGILKHKDGTVMDVVCNNGQVVHMYSKRLNRSIEVWHHLEALLVLGILMGLFAYWQM